MKPKYLNAAIVVLSLLVMGIQPALGTKYIPGDPDIGTWDSGSRIYTLTTDVYETIQIDEDNLTLDGAGHTVTGPGTGNGIHLDGRTRVTVKDVSVEGFYHGIFLNESSNNTLTGNTTNNYIGIELYDSFDNILVGNTASNNSFGIALHYSGTIGNTLTGNTVNSNIHAGILLYYCSDNTLTGNTANSNTHSGILLTYSSGNSLAGNTASNSSGDERAYGIQLHYSSNNTLSDNTANSNNNYGILLIYDCSNNTLSGNTTSDNAIGIYLAHYSNDNTLTSNTALSNTYGIVVRSSSYNTLSENTASNNRSFGIQLFGDGDGRYSRNNTLTDNTISYNHNGIHLYRDSSDSTLTGNMISYNYRGISIKTSNDNQIYNNNFISNTMQAPVLESTGNVFSLPKPIGGNYWSGWTGPDADSDGIVDTPYLFTGGQDDLPWVAQDGWLEPGWSPPGTDVIVQPVDETTGETLATLSFDNITEGGMTTVTSMTPGENQGPPQGFRFGAPPVIIDILTTATFTGEVAICFDYSGMSFGNESSLKLFHSSDGSNWVDITTSVDTENDIICGVVESFSFFGVFETADPVVLLEELAQQVTALNLQQGIDNSLDAKLDAALSALDDVNANNNVAAVNTLQAFVNAVEAQRGNKIPVDAADDLIAAANEIIILLSGS